MNDAFTRQVQDFTRQAQEMFTAGKDAKVPENVSAFAEDAIAKSRDAYHKFTSFAKDNAKVAEEVLLTTQAGAKSIGEKIVANTLANTEAAFEAAQAMARARTFPEIARKQTIGSSSSQSSVPSRKNSSNFQTRLRSRRLRRSARRRRSRSISSSPQTDLRRVTI
jgi:hypothetical protein